MDQTLFANSNIHRIIEAANSTWNEIFNFNREK